MASVAGLAVRELDFSTIEVDDSYEYEIMLDDSMIDEFASLTGDVSTLHMDGAFARSRGFSGRVCHGILLAGFFSRLVGVHLPGKNALLQMMNLKFLAPAYSGMTLRVKGTVDQVSEAAGSIVLKGEITNAHDDAVLVRAKIQVGITGR